MKKIRIILILFSTFMLVQGFQAQTQKAEALMDMLDLIRKEKFDFVLPDAMRENNIDMWIHVMGTNNYEDGNFDPLRLDLGSNTGFFIFTDRGGDRVERAVLGRCSDTARDCGAYDIFAPKSDLTQFVAKRDPKRIAVNYSEHLAVSDGISHTDYLRLVEALGDKYAKRMVSAEDLITDFRTRRVMSEIVFYGELCKKTVEVMEKGFDIIEPGITTLSDVSQWLTDQYVSRGFGSDIQFSRVGVFLRDPDGNENGMDDHVLQGGDLVHLDFGLIMMNYRTDIKRLGYVLREGETALPSEIQKVFDHALKVRKVFRKNIKVGPTAGETLEILISKLQESGYVYTGEDEYDRTADPNKHQVHFDFHCLGHSWGDEAVGPRISPWGQDRAHIKIPAYHLFVLEYMMHSPVPAWGKGKHIYMAIEDDVIVTDRGVEFLYSPIKDIRLIH